MNMTDTQMDRIIVAYIVTVCDKNLSWSNNYKTSLYCYTDDKTLTVYQLVKTI